MFIFTYIYIINHKKNIYTYIYMFMSCIFILHEKTCSYIYMFMSYIYMFIFILHNSQIKK
jgi:hypothetical protein